MEYRVKQSNLIQSQKSRTQGCFQNVLLFEVLINEMSIDVVYYKPLCITINFTIVGAIERETKRLDCKIKDIEKSTTAISNFFDEQKKSVTNLNVTMKDISKRMDNQAMVVYKTISEIKSENEKLRESVIDLQMRSLQNCVEEIHEFFEKELKLENSQDIKIDRAHRLGAKRDSQQFSQTNTVPKENKERWKLLQPTLDELLKKGGKPYFKGDKLL
ncbi:hypothetical protein KUTeg_024730 [Tegillarca granosa]|uniref:Uncharacterized protein n=1 Tax=Tegillarca granosa TaxID=220873 RepID=A0ABQ9E259_TEGGR|nr:hypothetical protein KUTeg_024730 [Tegillarca granosa]